MTGNRDGHNQRRRKAGRGQHDPARNAPSKTLLEDVFSLLCRGVVRQELDISALLHVAPSWTIHHIDRPPGGLGTPEERQLRPPHASGLSDAPAVALIEFAIYVWTIIGRAVQN